MTIRHILVPIDFSAHSTRVVDFARTVAEGVHAEVHLVHILEEPYRSAGPYEFRLPDTPARRDRLYAHARSELTQFADEMRVKDIRTTLEVRSGNVTEEIVKAAMDYGADLIVMGTQGRTGIHHLLAGSVAEDVIRRARCPVLAIRAHAGVVAGAHGGAGAAA